MDVRQRLTAAYLSRFAGGTFVVDNDLEDYRFEGTVVSITAENGSLSIATGEMRQTRGEGGVERKTYEITIDLITGGEAKAAELTLDTTPYLWEKITLRAPPGSDAAKAPVPSLVSDEEIARFTGGDIEVHMGPGELTDTWRGPIASASIVDDILVVSCGWVAFHPAAHPPGSAWTKDARTEFRIALADFDRQEVDKRLLLVHRCSPEQGLYVFIPPGRNLSPAKVRGLTV